MPQSLLVRIQEALDVSGAFDNCFFHSYAAHLLAYNLTLPEDLFTFASVLGNESNASMLQKKFPSADALSLFAEYFQRSRTGEEPVCARFIVEKTLILGFLMREWFATKMVQTPEVCDGMLAEVLANFLGYKSFRPSMESAYDLLPGPEGVLYAANLEFLEYFTVRPKEGELTAQEKIFEQYFIDHENETTALAAYWREEGFLNYCKRFATPGTKLAQNNIVPGMQILEQPLTIYGADAGVICSLGENGQLPRMEVVLHVQAGHYQLLKTDETAALLDEYEASFAQYKKDRAVILENPQNNFLALSAKSSLLVGSICPAEHIDTDPFVLLLNKIDFMYQFNQAHEQARVYLDKVMTNIDNALETLRFKVAELDEHLYPDSYMVASTLLMSLRAAQDVYRAELGQAGADRQKAGAAFKQQCAAIINKDVTSLLEHALGWRDYLTNLLRKLVNAVILVVTFGRVPTLFTPVRAPLVGEVEQAKKDLDADLAKPLLP